MHYTEVASSSLSYPVLFVFSIRKYYYEEIGGGYNMFITFFTLNISFWIIHWFYQLQ